MLRIESRGVQNIIPNLCINYKWHGMKINHFLNLQYFSFDFYKLPYLEPKTIQIMTIRGQAN